MRVVTKDSSRISPVYTAGQTVGTEPHSEWSNQKYIFRSCALFSRLDHGPVVKNLTSNAEDAGSIPGQGTKIPHATGQLSLHAKTRQSTRHN